mmetsp:Transcript_37549/g.91091  ORF Transcript_37549/g.91091 Transcript_37549/m.91091 type:complete len:85 (+) Transcript_37549:520-774(+)
MSATQSSKKRTVEEEGDVVTGADRNPFAMELADRSVAITSLEEENFIVFVKDICVITVIDGGFYVCVDGFDGFVSWSLRWRRKC